MSCSSVIALSIACIPKLREEDVVVEGIYKECFDTFGDCAGLQSFRRDASKADVTEATFSVTLGDEHHCEVKCIGVDVKNLSLQVRPQRAVLKIKPSR